MVLLKFQDPLTSPRNITKKLFSHFSTCLLISTCDTCSSFPACSSFQEVVCSRAERLRGHRATHQVIFSYCPEKHPGQVCTFFFILLLHYYDFGMILTNFITPFILCSCCRVCLKRTESGDALPGEPCEGLPAERAGGSVIQAGPAERPADRV